MCVNVVGMCQAVKNFQTPEFFVHIFTSGSK